MLNLYAHIGHVHEEVFIGTFFGLMFLNLLPFLGLALVLAVMNRLLKMNRNIQLVFVLVYLLLVGLLGYSVVPMASAISLVVGFGLSLALLFLPLKRR